MNRTQHTIARTEKANMILNATNKENYCIYTSYYIYSSYLDNKFILLSKTCMQYQKVEQKCCNYLSGDNGFCSAIPVKEKSLIYLLL